MRDIFFVLLFCVICGCTYHSQSKDPVSPVTYEKTQYRKANSVGLLRRLVLMPIEIKSYKDKDVSLKDRGASTQVYEDLCAQFLSDKKGYEIVVVRDSDGKWESGMFENSEYNNIRNLYQRWHKETADKHTASIIKEIGGALYVDGVLILRIKERKPWGVMEGLLNIALMNIPLFYSIASPDIGAWIYESATGRLVWRTETSTFGNKTPITANDLISLFADLENAVPRQLVK